MLAPTPVSPFLEILHFVHYSHTSWCIVPALPTPTFSLLPACYPPQFSLFRPKWCRIEVCQQAINTAFFIPSMHAAAAQIEIATNFWVSIISPGFQIGHLASKFGIYILLKQRVISVHHSQFANNKFWKGCLFDDLNKFGTKIL